MPAGVARVAVLRGAELIDNGIGRLLLQPLSAKRVVRQATRVLKAHRTVRFDGRIAYPELLIIEVAPEIVDACPEMFDRDGCRAIAEMIADDLEELDKQRPAIAIAFERNRGVDRGRGFRIARDPLMGKPRTLERPSATRGPGPGPTASSPLGPTVPRTASGERIPHVGDDIETLDALWRLLDTEAQALAGLPGLSQSDLDASQATRNALMGSHPLRTASVAMDLRHALDVARRAARLLADRQPPTSKTG